MVTIVDRTGEAKEFKFDGQVYTFRYWDKGVQKTRDTLVLPLEVASWLFGEYRSEHYIHTTDDQFVRRYGVVDAPEDWVATVGLDVLETAPLTRNLTRLEGWDAAAGDPLRVKAVIDTTVNPSLRRAPGDYANVGAPVSGRIGS